MTQEDKKLKVIFAPGCFDSFDGTQEELNDLIAQINAMAEDGSLFDQSSIVNLDESDEDEREAILALTDGTDNDEPRRILH